MRVKNLSKKLGLGFVICHVGLGLSALTCYKAPLLSTDHPSFFAMPKTLVNSKRSVSEVVKNSRLLRKVNDKFWGEAAKSSMFSKAIQKKDKDGNLVKNADGSTKLTRKKVRIISGHSTNIAVMGAAEAIRREQNDDVRRAGMQSTDDVDCAALLGVAPGSRLAIDLFMSALAQEYMNCAQKSQQAISRDEDAVVTAKTMNAAMAEANARIFNKAPRVTIQVNLKKNMTDPFDAGAEVAEAEDDEEEEAEMAE